MLLLEGSSETGPFRPLFNRIFRSPYFRKYISYERHHFLQNGQNLIEISKMQQQIEKIIFVSEIIASEFASLGSLYKAENTCDQHSVS